MSLFNLDSGKKAMQVADESMPEFLPIPNGKYEGTITYAEPAKSAAGHGYIRAQIDLKDGIKHFFTLNLEHPKAKEIAITELTRIFVYGYKNPPEKLETLKDIAAALTGTPVHVFIKQKGENEKGYMQYTTRFMELTPLMQKLDAPVAKKDDLPF